VINFDGQGTKPNILGFFFSFPFFFFFAGERLGFPLPAAAAAGMLLAVLSHHLLLVWVFALVQLDPSSFLFLFFREKKRRFRGGFGGGIYSSSGKQTRVGQAPGFQSEQNK